MRKPVYGHFTHILQKEKCYIESFCYNVVENHLYTKFEKKSGKRKIYWWFKKSIVFAYACSFMSFFLRNWEIIYNYKYMSVMKKSVRKESDSQFYKKNKEVRIAR